ncbi:MULTISPECIES: hypothetical protein [unclassified Streptomyces]|uniref:hypothetical protein n=1 Tax=unclassified Streptomyces TaxID=2593676 RepID=UPI00365F4892
MDLPATALPVVPSPVFVASGPDSVMAPSASGIAGSFPALDARSQSVLREWLQHMQELAKSDADPEPVNPAHL